MKTRIKNSVRFFAFALALSLSFILGCSCTKSKPEPDPLANWTFRSFPGWGIDPNGHNTNHIDKAISDDYQAYITTNKLSADAVTGFYEDTTGQHAIEFTAFPLGQNASWNYVLIYDKRNKRIKLIKYGYRRYQS